ncbi:3-hydroxyacyl-ACP dehydratase FabZ [Hazenella sp. IB182357]|uniref:3-hydroxyacyl-[acyl-carrier-protein] dehydratase FabZ n=1 Tax=Polycladospora coralii TaxID=2771432 RepID=A0A926NEP5_9BACL|nr:3-hydroxyacyl-ACP dehydratase FabZ [Polycladospora coralii]MBD1372174.1 3-hydroxyacyl-ACP dehydratase FabZ [Polycladospora coralii]MBS7530673.1 3-hydroxyacyl-ACP dehydratase FabZ [Polycladospora coralii]
MELDIQQIQKVIPHRYPFLLIDRILELDPGKKVIGIKNVTYNEPFFVGHFPDYPVMPGVLIVEALAQAGAVAMLGLKENEGKTGFLTGLDKFRFRDQVKPGDTLFLEVEMVKVKGSIGKGKAVARVENRIVADGEVMFTIIAV